MTPAPAVSNPLRRAWPLFALATLAMLALLAQWPLQAARDYRTLTLYQPTTCTVMATRAVHTTLRSDVQGGRWKRDVYYPEVMFTWRVAGRAYTAAGYDNYDGVTSDAGVLVYFRVNAIVPCWYDPSHPERAVVARTFSRAYYATGAIPLAMALIAMAFLSASLRSRPTAARLATSTGAVLAVRLAPGATQRQATVTQLTIAVLLATLLVAYCAYTIRADGVFGPVANGFGFFFLLLAAADAFAFRMAWRGLRSFGVPAPEVELDHEPVQPGELVSVAVRIPGPVSFRDLKVSLVCEHQGSTTRPSTHHRVLNEASGESVAGGWYTQTGTMQVPEDAAPSAQWADTVITWKIVVRFTSGAGGTLNQEYPFRVITREEAASARL